MQCPRVKDRCAPFSQGPQHGRCLTYEIVFLRSGLIPEYLVRVLGVRPRQPRRRAHVESHILQGYETCVQHGIFSLDERCVRMDDLPLASAIAHQTRKLMQCRRLSELGEYYRTHGTFAHRFVECSRNYLITQRDGEIATIVLQKHVGESLYGLDLPLFHVGLGHISQIVEVLAQSVSSGFTQHVVDSDHPFLPQYFGIGLSLGLVRSYSRR
mmetsp:Transcript_37218/g.89087  ORF Transcript_37218/g.89087 Transcript_37218/m.89087 type:complete len:212 (-) Transcript_37218:337-972(-)